jgi:Holliday junction DNA helicase RuvB
LAKAVVRFFGTRLHVLVARKDLTLEDLVAFFKLASAHDTIFIDELQALQPALEELLFGIIDESKLPPSDITPGASEENPPLPPLHFIAATDRPGKILTPLKRRFALTLQFEAYTARELDAITRQRATEFGMILSPQAAKLLARTSRGIPRLAGQRLRLLRDFYGTLPPSEFALPHIRKFLHLLGVNDDGLGRLDRSYLAVALEQGEAGVSLRTLAARLAAIGLHQSRRRGLRRRGTRPGVAGAIFSAER